MTLLIKIGNLQIIVFKLKKIYYFLLCIILIGCTKNNNIVHKKEICNISQKSNLLKIDCDENNETYYIKNNSLNNPYLKCKKISFDIKTKKKISTKNYLECHLEGNEKKIYFFE